MTPNEQWWRWYRWNFDTKLEELKRELAALEPTPKIVEWRKS